MKWISTKEQMPGPHIRVLVHTAHNQIEIASSYIDLEHGEVFDPDAGEGSLMSREYVTHWMYLPEKPNPQKS